MSRKSKYTRNQQSAYHSGRGYAVANEGRRITFKSKEMQSSFLEGYEAGKAAIKKSEGKYPKK